MEIMLSILIDLVYLFIYFLVGFGIDQSIKRVFGPIKPKPPYYEQYSGNDYLYAVSEKIASYFQHFYVALGVILAVVFLNSIVTVFVLYILLLHATAWASAEYLIWTKSNTDKDLTIYLYCICAVTPLYVFVVINYIFN